MRRKTRRKEHFEDVERGERKGTEEFQEVDKRERGRNLERKREEKENVQEGKSKGDLGQRRQGEWKRGS